MNEVPLLRDRIVAGLKMSEKNGRDLDGGGDTGHGGSVSRRFLGMDKPHVSQFISTFISISVTLGALIIGATWWLSADINDKYSSSMTAVNMLHTSTSERLSTLEAKDANHDKEIKSISDLLEKQRDINADIKAFLIRNGFQPGR